MPAARRSRARTTTRTRTRTRAKAPQLHEVDLELHPNEASDLLPAECASVVEAHGWERAFYTVLDEGVIEDCIAVLGHAPGEDPAHGWESHRVHCLPGRGAEKTEDAEALARKDGWVHVIGSHYGSKAGPLEARRAFMARFREAELTGDLAEAHPRLEISRNRFAVHRAINDALRASSYELLEPGPRMRKAFIDATIKLGEKKKKRWAGRVQEGDFPLNIEGAAFSPWGTLLIGLRYPVARDGSPVMVELLDVERLFEDEDSAVHAGAIWKIEGPGRAELPRGFRALHANGRELHAIFGSLDALGKKSSLIEDFPEGGEAFAEHWTFRLRKGGGRLKAEKVREFPNQRSVEGLAVADGHLFYVVDEDERVNVRFLRVD